VGAEPDRLRLDEVLALADKWIAMEIYHCDTQPSRRIAAVGDSVAECIRQLVARELDPNRFELRIFKRP
jgi:hypothetical protein